MILKIISYFPAILGLLSIGGFVYLNNPKSVKNRAFAALNLFIALWLLSLFIGDSTHNNTLALYGLRAGLFFGAFMFLSFYLFSLVFPFQSQINKAKQLAISLPIIIIAFTSFTSLQVATVSIQDFGVQPDKVGALYSISDFLGIAYLLLGIFILLLKYRKSDANQKNQIKFILFGLSFAIVINIFTGIILTSLKIDTDVILFGSFSLFVFSLFVAFAIIKHGFLDIRLIVARTLAYILSIASLVGVYTIFVLGISKLLFPDQEIIFARQILYLTAAIGLGLSVPAIKRFYDKLTNTLFYRDAYEPQELLNELNSVLVSSINLNEVLKQCAETIQKHLKSDSVAFYIEKTDNTSEKFISVGDTIEPDFGNLYLRKIEKIHTKIINTEEIDESGKSNFKDQLASNISIVAKLSTSAHGHNLGYLILSSKKSGSFYGAQDLRIIEIISDELAIAIQNALRFEEIQQFNVTLQGKVDEATKQLRSANEKLKALDETKDEFISMASHQLRTPLTTVKGYLSMVLEGDAGKVPKNQQKLLDQSFVSAQRMVYLIADLLNVSRLRTGKFVIDNTPTNLADVVEGEIDQLIKSAKDKDLELTYKKPTNFPTLMLDETKIRQVIMNFADNAIYYTPAGGHIQVNLVETPQSVELTVVDDGIGVPKSEQHHMFTKFYRAGNAKKARPDGTGLGLFMAKKVVIAQGGAIIFKTEEGKGSTFGFSFSKDKLKVPSHVKADPKSAGKKEPSLK